MHKPTLLIKLLKEPLLHFLLIGFGFFVLFSQMNPKEENTTKPIIHIKKSIINEIAMTFREENKKEATKEELEVLVKQRIREEVLANEAMAMGLNTEDKVIRHRLAEKMSYLFEDVAILEDPSEAILKAYFKENAKQFKENAKYEDIEAEIKEAWINYTQAKENELFYESLKSRYTIQMDDI
ncbi:hypothetical protein MNB_SV-13-1749 [hydrothermal vent metagenome]|uniref:Uncharacterized protein n=1 Tax=hydrothermal vent metagenome TaxID=652676 RepID=A0A1W1CIE7_9ZZZZ